MQRLVTRNNLVAGVVAAVLSMVACVPSAPLPGPATLALAYSNLDGIEGYDPGGPDALVSKLVDSNRDGVVSVGDTVVTDKYPLDPVPTGFGNFQRTTHEVELVRYAEPLFVSLQVEGGATIWFSLGEPDPPEYEPFEQYIEVPADGSNGWVQIIDVHPGVGHTDDKDWVMLNGTPPSLPEDELSTYVRDADDSDFLDVDIFV